MRGGGWVFRDRCCERVVGVDLISREIAAGLSCRLRGHRDCAGPGVRGAQHQAAHLGGVQDRQGLGDHAAHRPAQHVRPAQAEGVDERTGLVGHGVDGGRRGQFPGQWLRTADPSVIEHHHPVVPGEGVNQPRMPALHGPGVAHDQDQRGGRSRQPGTRRRRAWCERFALAPTQLRPFPVPSPVRSRTRSARRTPPPRPGPRRFLRRNARQHVGSRQLRAVTFVAARPDIAVSDRAPAHLRHRHPHAATRSATCRRAPWRTCAACGANRRSCRTCPGQYGQSGACKVRVRRPAMLTKAQIAKITAAKKMTASGHGIWITSIPPGRRILRSPQDRLKHGDGCRARQGGTSRSSSRVSSGASRMVIDAARPSHARAGWLGTSSRAGQPAAALAKNRW